MTYVPWEFEVQFAPGFSPLSAPTDADWDSLGSPASVSIRRGRQDDLDAFEAGTMTVVIDNSDELLDHLLSTSVIYDQDALPFTPLRLLARKGVTDDLPDGYDVRTLFSGFTLDGFAPAGLRGGGNVTVQVIDWLGWAETVEAPDSPWSAWAAYCKPRVWMRGYTNQFAIGYNDNPNGVAYNSAAVFSGAGYDMVPDSSYPDSVDRGSGGIVTDSPSPGFRTGFVGFAGLEMDGTPIAQAATWMAAGWFQTDNPQTITWAGSDWSVYINASGHVVAEVDVNGSNETDTVTADHTDGESHVWVLTVKSVGGSKAMKIETDMGVDSHAFIVSGVSGGGVLSFRGFNYLTGALGDFVYWDDPDAVAAVIADGSFYDAGQGPSAWAGDTENMGMWSGDTITERLARVFRMCGVDAVDSQVRANAAYTVRTVTATTGALSETLAGLVRQLGDAYLGAAYVLRDGTLRIRDATVASGSVDLGDSLTYDFATVEALISDQDTSVWIASASDNFNRSNNVSIIAGNADWQIGSLDGTIGVTSNAAYVSDAAAAEPIVYFQDLGRDVTVQCGFASVVEGQGLVVRHAAYGTFIAVTQGSGTVEVSSWVDGVSTLIGDTGADTIGSILVVTTDDNLVTVRIDGGTIHEFTITEPANMAGVGVGLAYTDIGVLPASSARWDGFIASCTRPLIRPTTRSRTAPRADRVVNFLNIDDSIYLQDADSIRRYGRRPREWSNVIGSSKDTLEEYGLEILAAKKDPVVEVGEITLMPWGNQYLTDWAMRDLELERPVQYREALYMTGTEVLDATYRVASEAWDISEGVGWTITLKLVPA